MNRELEKKLVEIDEQIAVIQDLRNELDELIEDALSEAHSDGHKEGHEEGYDKGTAEAESNG